MLQYDNMLPTIPGHFSTGPPNGLPVLWRSFHTPGVVPKGSRCCCRAPLPARRQAHLVASGIFCNGRHRRPGGMVVTYGDLVVLDPKMIQDPWSKNDPKVKSVNRGWSPGWSHHPRKWLKPCVTMISNQVLLGMVTQVGPRMPNKDNCMILHGTPPSRNRLSRSSLSRASTAAVQDSSLNSSSCTGHPALRCSKCVAHPDVMPLVARIIFVSWHTWLWVKIGYQKIGWLVQKNGRKSSWSSESVVGLKCWPPEFPNHQSTSLKILDTP